MAKKKKKKIHKIEFDTSSLESFRNSILDGTKKLLQEKVLNSSFYTLDDPNVPTRMKRVIPSGMPNFDLICCRTPMGRCGLPIGRQIEIYGPFGCGKTSLACKLIAAAQSKGWIGHWLEHENKFDPDRAETLGVDCSKVIFGQPHCLEDTIDSINSIMDGVPERKDLPEAYKSFGTIVVVDSVAAMPSRTELEGSMEDNNIGVFQRKMSQAMRQMTNRLSKRNITIVWINQIRDKLGFGAMKGGKSTYGGNALKFYCAQRWKMWSQKNAEKGMLIHIENDKNQCGVRPYLKCDVFLNFEDGFDYVDSWCQAMQNLYIADRVGNAITMKKGNASGSKFTMKKLRNMYEENPEWFFDYEKIIKDNISEYHVLKKQKKEKDGDSKEE